MKESILAVDVGSGTQDIILYLPEKNIENCPKMVMPSRTQIVAAQIRSLTAKGADLFLSGQTMGGGASSVALKNHLKQGLKVYATPEAAKTFNDNLDVVKNMGVEVVSQKPAGTLDVVLGDVDVEALSHSLRAFGLELPDKFLIAVQDHGESPNASNRVFRFKCWRDFILEGGELKDLLYKNAPNHFTRMGAVQSLVPNSWVMDTGSAAVWGILADGIAGEQSKKGLIALNIGNSHTLGVAVKDSRVWGLFEHHTGTLSTRFLADQIAKLQNGTLTNDEVFNAGGHGAYLHPEYEGGFEFVVLTGPRWELADGLGFYRAAPFGDMMLTGGFGLLAAYGTIPLQN